VLEVLLLKIFPDKYVVAGNPARMIRKLEVKK